MSDGVVLTGLPGTGKTTVGRRVAQVMGKPFVDLDERIMAATGRSPAEILLHDGEQEFRRLETAAVADACAIEGAVIAAGGGATIEPLNRWSFMTHGLRIRLDAPLDQLATRLAADAVARPLLDADVRAGLARTASDRAAVYAAIDATVDAGADVATVTSRIVDAATSGRSVAGWRALYDTPYRRHHAQGSELGRVIMGRALDGLTLRGALSEHGISDWVAIADARAVSANAALRADLGTTRLCVVEGGEQVKTLAQLGTFLEWLASARVERGAAVVVVGGGTLGDAAGLAAALHRRGVPLVNIPTTWLAQADSSIGGKVAVDLPAAKNGVGAFWPPWLILTDVDLPATLPIERRRDGMVECLKAGLIGDPALWTLVAERGRAALHGEDPAAAYALTERAARLKLAIVDRDPYEEGERRLLNLGHTLGHALEVESGFAMSHGEAVGLGLRAVAAIAASRGAEAGLAEAIDEVLGALGIRLTRGFDQQAVVEALGSDKKRRDGVQRWLLPFAVGRVEEVTDVTATEISRALQVIAA